MKLNQFLRKGQLPKISVLRPGFVKIYFKPTEIKTCYFFVSSSVCGPTFALMTQVYSIQAGVIKSDISYERP